MKKFSALLVLAVMSVCGFAQTDTITGRVHQLEGVTLTKNQHHRIVTSTAPKHLLDRQDMLTMGVTDIADALHRLPGITLRDYGGAGGMKTVSVRGFGAKHTGVCYDGVMLSECQSGEIDLSRYSLDNVGSLSLTIGDNDDIFLPARQASVPAVLSIQTLRMPSADLKPHLTTQMKIGSFGYVSPFLRYEQSISERFSLSAVGEYTYAENDYPYTIKNGIEAIKGHRQNSRMNSGHGELNFVWDINQANRLSGKLYYYDNDRRLPGIVNYYSNTNRETLRDRNAFGQLSYQTRWGEKWALKANGKFNWAASLYDDGMMASQIQDANYYQREYYGSASVLYVPTEHWAFSYALDGSYNNLNSTLPMDTRPRRYMVLQALTAKYRNKRLTATGKLLHSLYLNSDKDGDGADNLRRLSPSLSLSYRIIDELHVRLSYKEIFRAPTFNENYYFHYGSKTLNPEKTQQLNVGLTWDGRPTEQLSIQATIDGYFNTIKDMIVAIPYNMFVWTCVNVGKVDVKGLDATLRANWHMTSRQQLILAGNYTYQHVVNHTNEDSPYYGNQIAYMPRHTGSWSLAWENTWVNLSLHQTLVGSRWSTNEHLEGTKVDGYNDLGATAYRYFRIGCGTLEARLDVKNLTDQQYEIVSGYPMPGISYQFSINYKF